MSSNKKKYIITGSLAAAALLVGGTAAFFTSSDVIVNPFATGSTTDKNNPKAGINVKEDFYGPGGHYDTNTAENGYGEVVGGPTEVLPGQVFTKKVRVDSTANYAQYVRAKVIVEWFSVSSDGSKTKITDTTISTNYSSKLNIVYNANKSTGATWIGSVPVTGVTSEWFYYSTELAKSPAYTDDLIKSVTLDSSAENEFKNLAYTVTVEAESVQATDDALLDAFEISALPSVLIP